LIWGGLRFRKHLKYGLRCTWTFWPAGI
jgi:hypothetical protein